jgi:sugar lactone lactonase YvrE
MNKRLTSLFRMATKASLVGLLALTAASCGKSGADGGTGSSGSSSAPASSNSGGTANADPSQSTMLYVCLFNQQIVNQIDSSGTIKQFANIPGNYTLLGGMAFDGLGNLYLPASPNGAKYEYQILKVDQNNTISVFSTPNTNRAAHAVAVDGNGNVYVIEDNMLGACQMVKVDKNGMISDPLQLPPLSQLGGMVCDKNGNVYIAGLSLNGNTADSIGRIGPDGSETLFTRMVGGSFPTGMTFDKDGNLYVCCPGYSRICKVSSDGSEVDTYASLPLNASPSSLAFDDNGNLYVTDINESEVWKVTPSGDVSKFMDVDHPGMIAAREVKK